MGLRSTKLCSDTWLHLAVQPASLTIYESVTYPPANVPPNPNNASYYNAGWTTIPECESTLTSPLPSNISDAPLPCSLNITGAYNVEDPSYVYPILAQGITPEPSDYNTYVNNLDTQINTYLDHDTNVSHSFLYNPNAAYENDSSLTNTSFGIDYTANTISMATTCTSVTRTCHFQSIPDNQTILTIPFNCSAHFHGDLGQPPANGLERIQGWDSGFYDMVDSVPKNVPVQAQSNPFTFFAAGAVNSLSFAELNASFNRRCRKRPLGIRSLVRSNRLRCDVFHDPGSNQRIQRHSKRSKQGVHSQSSSPGRLRKIQPIPIGTPCRAFGWHGCGFHGY